MHRMLIIIDLYQTCSSCRGCRNTDSSPFASSKITTCCQSVNQLTDVIIRRRMLFWKLYPMRFRQQKKVKSCSLLDMSAAFETIYYDILLEQIHMSFGVRGAAISWISSCVRQGMQTRWRRDVRNVVDHEWEWCSPGQRHRSDFVHALDIGCGIDRRDARNQLPLIRWQLGIIPSLRWSKSLWLFIVSLRAMMP